MLGGCCFAARSPDSTPCLPRAMVTGRAGIAGCPARSSTNSIVVSWDPGRPAAPPVSRDVVFRFGLLAGRRCLGCMRHRIAADGRRLGRRNLWRLPGRCTLGLPSRHSLCACAGQRQFRASVGGVRRRERRHRERGFTGRECDCERSTRRRPRSLDLPHQRTGGNRSFWKSIEQRHDDPGASCRANRAGHERDPCHAHKARNGSKIAPFRVGAPGQMRCHNPQWKCRANQTIWNCCQHATPRRCACSHREEDSARERRSRTHGDQLA